MIAGVQKTIMSKEKQSGNAVAKHYFLPDVNFSHRMKEREWI